MKRFYDADIRGRETGLDHSSTGVDDPHVRSSAAGPVAARIAVYDDLRSAPRVEDVRSDSAAGFIENLSQRAYEVARDQGGSVPYTVIREVVENLIHARFAEVVVSIMDAGETIRFSDHGPGISDKDLSFEPGFSTATQPMKEMIRGVGSGLPIVKEYLSFSGGVVSVEDNLGEGTVVTLRLAGSVEPDGGVVEPEPPSPIGLLTTRHKQVLSLAMEFGAVGPSAVSQELGVGLSTAYRDLAFLEEQGLVSADTAGKRSLTDEGVSYLDALFAP